MGRLVRVAIVVVVLLVLADFGAKLLVQNLAASALASRRGVNGSVDVSFGAFPFLLALKDRHFGSVTVEAGDVRSGGFATASDVTPQTEARLESVRFELDDVEVVGDVWRDDPKGRVSAASGRGSATLTQESLNGLVPPEHAAHLTLRDGAVRVTVRSQLGRQNVDVPESGVRLDASTLVVEAPEPIGAISIPLPELVDGVTFEGVDVTSGALELTFSLTDVELKL
ncbi:MAG TPA: DUF2993 domain-containing protein [Actinomycetota bacterium]|nr:DUF2993 domain-containing protein [Actinomycetota bacterium]